MFFKHLFEINEELVDKKHIDNFYYYDGKCSLRLWRINEQIFIFNQVSLIK